MKKCPSCNKNLKKGVIYDVDIDYCSDCYGSWFEKDELRLAKDKKDEDLRWMDINLWKDQKKLEISKINKLCPECRIPLYEVNYGKSKIKVDVCNVCKGIWLDKGEFKEIVKYLKKDADWKILNEYTKSLTKEAWEVFTGPESTKEEIDDFLTVLRLFKYKFITQYPKISQIIIGLPK